MDLLGFGGAVAGPVISGIMGSRNANSANRQNTQNMLAETYFNNMMQDKEMAFNAAQAGITRDFNAAEAAKAREFSADQEVIARQFNSAEAAKARDWTHQEVIGQQDFNAAQAQKQIDFQERMRATQYQTAVQDMKAAGLSPMLAYSQGGAGTPFGAAASSSALSAAQASAGSASGPAASAGGASAGGGHSGRAYPAVVRPTIDVPNLLSSALQLAQIRNVDAQTEKTNAETFNVKAETIDASGPATYSALEKQQRAKTLSADAERAFEGSALSREQQKLVQEEVRNAVREGRRIDAVTGNVQADTVLKQLRKAEEAAGSKYWTANPDAYGWMQGLKMFGEGVSGAIGLKRLLTP